MPRAVPWLVAAALVVGAVAVLLARSGPERAGRPEQSTARATPSTAATPTTAPRPNQATARPTAPRATSASGRAQATGHDGDRARGAVDAHRAADGSTSDDGHTDRHAHPADSEPGGRSAGADPRRGQRRRGLDVRRRRRSRLHRGHPRLAARSAHLGQFRHHRPVGAGQPRPRATHRRRRPPGHQSFARPPVVHRRVRSARRAVGREPPPGAAAGRRDHRAADRALDRPWYRLPYGDDDGHMVQDLAPAGYTRKVGWTVDTLGWRGVSAAQIVERSLDWRRRAPSTCCTWGTRRRTGRPSSGWWPACASAGSGSLRSTGSVTSQPPPVGGRLKETPTGGMAVTQKHKIWGRGA